MPLTPARLALDGAGTPFSSDYGDVYHAAQGGPEQAQHVFLAGNDLPGRWRGRERFVIVETGFGLGLNFLATWQAWREDPARSTTLHFVSVEKHPFSAPDLARAHRAWPPFAPLSASLCADWPVLAPGVHRLAFDQGRVVLTLFFGDAVDLMRKIEASADAFYLDGFAPAKNPELWSPALCRALARLAAPGATLATWSVSGALRQALAAAEFDCEKRPGLAGKRHMLAARYRSRKPARAPRITDRRVIIIGAGLAGSCTALALARRGWQVSVFEAGDQPGCGASGNLSGVLRPLPSSDDNRLSRLTRAGFLHTRALLMSLPDARWAPCGVLHLARDPVHEALQRRTVEALAWPRELLDFVDQEAASHHLGFPADSGGWWFAGGGWVSPQSLCAAALAAHPGITVHCATNIAHIEAGAAGWRVMPADPDRNGAEAPFLVMAAGVGATRFAALQSLPQKRARGQVSLLPASQLPPLPVVACRLGYVAPAVDGWISAGATFMVGDDDPALRLNDHIDNLARANLVLPGFASPLDPRQLSGRVGFRPASPDRLPIIGPCRELPAGPLPSGLYLNQGFGARGIVWCGLAAELLASQIEGSPLPLETDLVEAVSPDRFAHRQNRRSSRQDTNPEVRS